MHKKMDEEQRSLLWRFVVIGATCIIICVALFFGIRYFTSSPLKGIWDSEDDAFTLAFEEEEVVAMWEDASGSYHKMVLDYTIDKAEKTVSIRPKEDAESEESAGELAEQGLSASFGLITATFDYSVERDTLTLTEREYGEQLVFTRK